MKKRWFVISGIVCTYVLLQVIPYGKNKVDTPFKIKNGDRPLVIAHGGAKQLNPENTWMAFNYAVSLGVDVLEMDLQITKDQQLITYHNETLDELSTASGYIKDYTYEQLKQYNFGENFQDLQGDYPYRNLTKEQLAPYADQLIPARLEDLLKKFGDSMLYICELKNYGELGKQSAQEILNLIQKYGLEKNVCVASFDQATLNYFESIAPKEIVTSFDMDTATDFIKANYIGYGIFNNYRESGFQLPLKEKNVPLDLQYLIYKIHHNNMFVHYWTINNREDIISCIKKGADGIITDRPDLMLEILDEMNY